MAQLAEGMGEVSYVDPLAAAMGMAAVAEQPDAQGAIVQSIRHWVSIRWRFSNGFSYRPLYPSSSHKWPELTIVRESVDLSDLFDLCEKQTCGHAVTGADGGLS
jgi:hypothetical protein